MLNGARQVGKSTLIENLIKTEFGAKYFSLDDYTTLFASLNDPINFLEQHPYPIAIDEVQRNPKLFMAIKKIVDAKKTNGLFLLTGSANVLTIPKLSESLAGRMVIHSMHPLSQGELINKKENFLNWCFNSSDLPKTKNTLSQTKLIDLLSCGSFPRAIKAEDEEDRIEWIKSYLDTILQRDVLSLSKIEGLKELPNILSIIAQRTANLLNISDIGRIIKINKVTLKRYYTLLQMVYLINEVPAWFVNMDKRIAKAPKVYINDTGIASYLKQVNKNSLIEDRSQIGPILENFVTMELKKQISWNDSRVGLFHFRTQNGKEVDLVLEGINKKIVGIEVKASSEINSNDLLGIHALKEIAKNRLIKSIILYTGKEALSVGNNIYALPINYLWDI